MSTRKKTLLAFCLFLLVGSFLLLWLQGLQGVFEALVNSSKTDQVTSNQLTGTNLSILADCIVLLSKKTDLFKKDLDSNGIFPLLVSNELLPHEEEPSFKTDCWGTQIQISINPNSRTISLLSAGKNRLFENGEGDDLRVDIILSNPEKPRMTFRFPTGSGKTIRFTRSY